MPFIVYFGLAVAAFLLFVYGGFWLGELIEWRRYKRLHKRFRP
jgi:hypothetical protein